ncbi:unnamed protein product [Calypogeia fissa]
MCSLLLRWESGKERTARTKSALARHHHKETMDAIVEASHYPLSIIVVGVGDGSFVKFQTVNEELKQLSSPPLFNNYKFVNFSKAIREGWEPFFAYHALRDIPVQYTTARSLGLLRSAAMVTVGPPRSHWVAEMTCNYEWVNLAVARL